MAVVTFGQSLGAFVDDHPVWTAFILLMLWEATAKGRSRS